GRLIVETTNLRLTREFVALRTGLSAGEYVRVSVQDTGPGMSPELADRALNPFFTSKGQDGHLGLGLSAAYGFANQSGGHIEIDGGEGRGVTIDLYFPRAEEVTTESLDEDASAEASEGGPVVRPAASKGRF
ncbi:MAG: ATP-binding protein, partial [Kiloniellaceae bacterium]